MISTIFSMIYIEKVVAQVWRSIDWSCCIGYFNERPSKKKKKKIITCVLTVVCPCTWASSSDFNWNNNRHCYIKRWFFYFISFFVYLYYQYRFSTIIWQNFLNNFLTWQWYLCDKTMIWIGKIFLFIFPTKI